MEGNAIKFAQGNMDESTWLQFSKIKNSVLIPEKEQSEVIKDFKNQKYHSRLLKLSKANLIFFYIGNKILFLDKSNLSTIFRKELQSTYDNFHYWEFESEIKYIRIIDLKYPVPRDDVSLEELDKIYSERLIMIFLADKYILIESDKFVFLLDCLNKGNFNASDYFLNNTLILDINKNLNTDNFIIFDDNQPENNNDSYHFFYINYPENMNKNLMYLSEIYSKNLSSYLHYFKIKKNAITKNDSAPNPYKICSSKLNIIELGIKALLLEHIESNLICLNINENLSFFKLQFFNDQPPKLIPATIQNENSSTIDLKKIAFQDKDPNEEILDLCLIKKIRPNCLLLSGFEYSKSSKSPNKDSYNTNFFIQYTYDNLNGILNDVNISFFIDTYYPDDVYNFQSKPVMEAIHLNYQVEILLLVNSQDKQIESFAFSDEIDSLEIKFALLEDEYKFCLPVFDEQNDEYSKNAVPIGITFIDFLFDGYDKEKYIINADEVYAPYLILILDNYGRLFFGYIVNKLLTENPLKKDERETVLKGSFKIPLISEAISKPQTKVESQPLPQVINVEAKPVSNFFGNLNGAPSIMPKNNQEQFDFSFGGDTNFANNQTNANVGDKNEKDNKFKDIFLKDNKLKEDKEQQQLQQQNNLLRIKPKTSEKKIDINVDKSKDNLIKLDIKENKKEKEEEYENVINLDKLKKQDAININTQSKAIQPNIPQRTISPQLEEEISSGSDSENVSTSSFQIVNKPCEKIYSNEAAKEGQKILTNPRIEGSEIQLYSEKIEEYRKQKEQLMQLREKEKKELLGKFEKDSNEIKAETQRIIKQKEDEYQKRLAELEKQKRKIIEMEEVREKKRFEDIDKSKEEAVKINYELKEKIFNESKKNIACNLEVYLEIIKNKVDGFMEETQKLQRIQEEMDDNEKIYNDIEKEIENYNSKKEEVENKIYAFYDIDYNANIEYLSKRFNNLAEIVFKNNKKLSSEEIEEFIYNNQLNLSAENKKKVLSIKQNYEKMILRFNEKLAKFKKQAEESEKLIEKFSDNKKVNDILELNNKYEGSLNKFVQSYPQENYRDSQNNFVVNANSIGNTKNNQNNNTDNPAALNFNFNRSKFNLKKFENKSSNINKPQCKLTNYNESAHTKIFEEIMKEYEIEFESLKNKYETIKKEVENLHYINNNQSPNNIIAEFPINAGFNFNKRVFSESAIKTFYKNYKEKNINCSQDPFNNINHYNELKNNMGKVLKNQIPSVEYIDDSGDDFDEIFNKDGKPDKALKASYNPKANAAEFRETIKCEFANIFATQKLKEVFQKYKEKCNQSKIIENAQAKANREFESKNKNLSAFAQDLKNDNKEGAIAKNKAVEIQNSSKTSSKKNFDSSLNSLKNSQGDNNSSMLSTKLNESNIMNNNLKQIIPEEKKQEPKLFEKPSISEQPKAEKPKPRENSVESSQEKKPSQPKEHPFGFKQENEFKEDKATKSAFQPAGGKSTSLFPDAVNKNLKSSEAPLQKEAEKPKENIPTNLSSNLNTNSANLFSSKPASNPFQNAVNNPLIPKPNENENKAEIKAPGTASTGLFSELNSGGNLFSGAALQQNQEEINVAKDKEPKSSQAAAEIKKDAFSSLIPNANNQMPAAQHSENMKQTDKEKKEVQPEAPKSTSLFSNLSANQVSSENKFNPFNTAAKAPIPQTGENKKETVSQENKTAPPLENANVVLNLFNQNLSFSKQPDSAENKAKTETNANKQAADNSNKIPQTNANSLFVNLQPKSVANNVTNLNQDNEKKEENKNSVFAPQANTASNANNTGISFANLFKPSVGPPGAVNQVSTFPGFGKPQQGSSDANKPAASIFSNLPNQGNSTANNAQIAGFAGFGQNSSLNANQQQSNPFGANAVPNADSNAIPKFGFGQSSSLGAPIAAKPPSTNMSIGFGKNLGTTGGFGNQGGFAGLKTNNAVGFFGQNQGGFAQNQGGFGQNQGGFGQNQGGFGQNQGGNMPFSQNPNNNINSGFGAVNNNTNSNPVNVGFGGGFNMNNNPNNGFAGGFNNPNNANNNMFFNQQQQQQQNNMNRPGAGAMKNDYDF